MSAADPTGDRQRTTAVSRNLAKHLLAACFNTLTFICEFCGHQIGGRVLSTVSNYGAVPLGMALDRTPPPGLMRERLCVLHKQHQLVVPASYCWG